MAVKVRAPVFDRSEAADLAGMWDLTAREGNWNLRAALLHLAVWRLESPATGASPHSGAGFPAAGNSGEEASAQRAGKQN